MTLREKLEKRDGDAERWSPEPNDILIGKVREIREVTTRYGEGKVVDIENEDGTFTVFLTAVLQSHFLQKEVEEGTRVGIKYLGQIKGQDGRRYKNYAVEVDENSGKEDGQREELSSADEE